MRKAIAIMVAGTLFAGEAAKSAAPEAAAPAEGPRLGPQADLLGLAKLKGRTLDAKFQATTLDDAVAFIAQQTGANIVIHPGVYVKKPAEQRRLTFVLANVTGEVLLKTIARLNDLDIIYEDDVFILAPKEQEPIEPVTRAYNVGLLRVIHVPSHFTAGDELIQQIAETGGIISTDYYKSHFSDDFRIEKFERRMDANASYYQGLAAIASGMIEEYGGGKGKAVWVPGTDVIVVVASPDVQARFAELLLTLADAAGLQVKKPAANEK